MNYKKYFFLIVPFLLSLPTTVSAVALSNPLGTTDVRVLVGNIIKAVLGLSGVAAFVMFIWGGAQWMLSGGVKDKIKKGQDTVVWAALGLIFIFIAYTVLYTLLSVIGSATSQTS